MDPTTIGYWRRPDYRAGTHLCCRFGRHHGAMALTEMLRPPRGWHAVAATGAVGLVLTAFAARADQRAVGARPALTLLDLAVGVAFVVASLAATGPALQRVLVAAVGAAWLIGSIFVSALSVHQAMLALALLAFPVGRIRGILRLLLGAGAFVIGAGVVPQLGLAAFFAAVGVGIYATVARTAVAAYPTFAAVAVAAILWFDWWSVQHGAVGSPLVSYECTLIAVAVGFAFATRIAARRVARRLGDAVVTGLPGLQLVLARVLDDPQLRIERCAVDATDEVDVDREWVVVPVHAGGRLIARVMTKSSVTADRRTVDAIAAVVRLAVENGELQDQQMQRIAELEASRVRLLAAVDGERQQVAERLRSQASAYLQDALTELADAKPADHCELSDLIDFAASEVAAAAEEVDRIIAGTPPAALGSGGLPAAVAVLAARCTTPVTVHVDADAIADAAIETALFYVCSEALANASKYSGATHLVIDLHCRHDQLVLVLRDDGCGGADPAGSGLLGLTDRMAAVGGHLTVRSPVGRGTVITATVPLG
jgi:signal transduction histidine kinase